MKKNIATYILCSLFITTHIAAMNEETYQSIIEKKEVLEQLIEQSKQNSRDSSESPRGRNHEKKEITQNISLIHSQSRSTSQSPTKKIMKTMFTDSSSSDSDDSLDMTTQVSLQPTIATKSFIQNDLTRTSLLFDKQPNNVKNLYTLSKIKIDTDASCIVCFVDNEQSDEEFITAYLPEIADLDITKTDPYLGVEIRYGDNIIDQYTFQITEKHINELKEQEEKRKTKETPILKSTASTTSKIDLNNLKINNSKNTMAILACVTLIAAAFLYKLPNITEFFNKLLNSFSQSA